MPRLRPLLYDPLPEDVKPSVAVLDRYWLTAEAASVYARAAAVVSFEMHSPIMAVATGTPAVQLRQPTDTRKGQMWRDVGLDAWLFEIDDSTGEGDRRPARRDRPGPAGRPQDGGQGPEAGPRADGGDGRRDRLRSASATVLSLGSQNRGDRVPTRDSSIAEVQVARFCEPG